MKILICMDSWKGSLTALEACEAAARGLGAVLPGAEIRLLPLADGGEGTLEAVSRCRPGELRWQEVTGPFADRRVRAPFLYWPAARTALIEMAVCAGLPLLRPEERDPLRSTTRGVGELMRAAQEAGAENISLALGGSATVDGGCGMAEALGWQFLDAGGAPLPPGGGALRHLAKVIPPAAPFPVKVDVWCDVTNPLTGPQGAAEVFGPQKGATAQQVRLLAEGLEQWAVRVKEATGREVAELPGGGAAGGMGAGAVAFLSCRLMPGIDALAAVTDLDAAVAAADWVITGEGSFDAQSLGGKVVSDILARAARGHTRVGILAGKLDFSAAEMRREGISAAEAANAAGRPLEEALAQAKPWAEAAARRLGAKMTTA